MISNTKAPARSRALPLHDSASTISPAGRLTRPPAPGAALSGAGPTVLCFHDTRESTTGLHDYLHGVMKRNGLEGCVMDFPIDTAGTVVTRHS